MGLIRESTFLTGTVKKEEILEWEEETVLTLDERHMRWKAAAAVLVLSVLDILNFLVVAGRCAAAEQRKYHGSTVCREFQRYAEILSD